MSADSFYVPVFIRYMRIHPQVGVLAQDMLNTMVSEETWSSRKSKEYGTQSA